jgi:hypothetical protein
MLNGLKMEKHVIDTHALYKSSKFQDTVLDIDAFDGDISVSIKTQHTALRTGNLAIEFALVDAGVNTIDSWFINGEAEEYWFVIDDTIFVYNASKLKAWVNKNKSKLRVTGLTDKSLIAENHNQKRKYMQSRCYLVNMDHINHLVERELFL